MADKPTLTVVPKVEDKEKDGISEFQSADVQNKFRSILDKNPAIKAKVAKLKADKMAESIVAEKDADRRKAEIKVVKSMEDLERFKTILENLKKAVPVGKPADDQATLDDFAARRRQVPGGTDPSNAIDAATTAEQAPEESGVALRSPESLAEHHKYMGSEFEKAHDILHDENASEHDKTMAHAFLRSHAEPGVGEDVGGYGDTLQAARDRSDLKAFRKQKTRLGEQEPGYVPPRDPAGVADKPTGDVVDSPTLPQGTAGMGPSQTDAVKIKREAPLDPEKIPVDRTLQSKNAQLRSAHNDFGSAWDKYYNSPAISGGMSPAKALEALMQSKKYAGLSDEDKNKFQEKHRAAHGKLFTEYQNRQRRVKQIDADIKAAAEAKNAGGADPTDASYMAQHAGFQDFMKTHHPDHDAQMQELGAFLTKNGMNPNQVKDAQQHVLLSKFRSWQNLEPETDTSHKMVPIHKLTPFELERKKADGSLLKLVQDGGTHEDKKGKKQHNVRLNHYQFGGKGALQNHNNVMDWLTDAKHPADKTHPDYDEAKAGKPKVESPWKNSIGTAADTTGAPVEGWKALLNLEQKRTAGELPTESNPWSAPSPRPKGSIADQFNAANTKVAPSAPAITLDPDQSWKKLR